MTALQGIGIAFDDPAWTASPIWTRIDTTTELVASYQIDRGRSVELDLTSAASATVRINDIHGTLDPANSAGPYYGKIEPLLQAGIARWNPVLHEWQTRFRGFIDDYDYIFDPSQKVNQLELSLVDVFSVLADIEMFPTTFGDDPTTIGLPDSVGQVVFRVNSVGRGSGVSPTYLGRIPQIMGNIGVDPAFYVCFSGNVLLWPTVYSPGESAMTAIQECADAEFPGVANVFTDRFGRLCFHGRLAKFDPATIAAGAGSSAWDWTHWHAGDGAAVIAAGGPMAQIREFAYNLGRAQVINYAASSPIYKQDGSGDGIPLSATDLAGQIVQNTTSQGHYGLKTWSRQDLLTMQGLLDSADALTETKRFATFYVDNYSVPIRRVNVLGFRTIRPDDHRAADVWHLLSNVDISDQVDVTMTAPGGGMFSAEPFFVEGIHETVEGRLKAGASAGESYDNVTLRLDVSPTAYFTSNPFPTH